ncbi:hypothetical protein ACFL02_05600, partial [Planctomycetota bacterium]
RDKLKLWFITAQSTLVLGLDREVAIKSLPDEVVSNPKVKARFRREAKLLGGLNHPNISTIHDEIEEVANGHKNLDTPKLLLRQNL